MNNIYEEVSQTFENACEASDEREAAKRFDLFNCEELCDMRLERAPYIVSGVLKPGLAILAGSPKIGKSWMVLNLCIRIAKGEPFLGLPTEKGTVLYIALEDSKTRLQERVLSITDSAPAELYFSLNCLLPESGLENQLQAFVNDHPDTGLVVIDTFQMIRSADKEMSYANDYAEVSRLKQIADRLNICLLLVHHTRKLGDSDCMNEISGTNGIAGCADTLMVLKKDARASRKASLVATGRDIEDRIMELTFDPDSFLWNVKSDSVGVTENKMPREMELLIAYMSVAGYYFGSSADFTADYSRRCGVEIAPNQLKRLMNRWRFELEKEGVNFATVRRKAARMLMISYADPHTADTQADSELPLREQKADCPPVELPEQEDVRCQPAPVDIPYRDEDIPLPTDADCPPDELPEQEDVRCQPAPEDIPYRDEDIPLPTDADCPPERTYSIDEYWENDGDLF